jgi:hypothetical protein
VGNLSAVYHSRQFFPPPKAKTRHWSKEQQKMSKPKRNSNLKHREEGFDLNSISQSKLSEYSALHDPNMRHYFENPNVQRLLYQSGQIDRHGRVINLEKNKSKLQILEREFKDAERMEERKIKEEMEMRVSPPSAVLFFLTSMPHFSSLTLSLSLSPSPLHLSPSALGPRLSPSQYRVQRKRFQQLEEIQKKDLMTKLKADRELSHEILSTIRSTARTMSPNTTFSRAVTLPPSLLLPPELTPCPLSLSLRPFSQGNNVTSPPAGQESFFVTEDNY